MNDGNIFPARGSPVIQVMLIQHIMPPRWANTGLGPEDNEVVTRMQRVNGQNETRTTTERSALESSSRVPSLNPDAITGWQPT